MTTATLQEKAGQPEGEAAASILSKTGDALASGEGGRGTPAFDVVSCEVDEEDWARTFGLAHSLGDPPDTRPVLVHAVPVRLTAR